MLLKKYSYLLLAGLLSTAFVACDDDGDGITDDTDPVITLTSPTAEQLQAGFAPGSTITITGTVTDNRDLEKVDIMLTGPNQMSLFNETITEDNFSGNSVTINQTVTIPATTPAGTYTLTVTAMDDGDNVATQPWTITVNEVSESNASFTVTVPTGTPETAAIYLVGLDNTDDSDDMYMLTRNEDGTYSGNFMFPEGEAESFYFRIKSDDETAPDKFREVNADCSVFSDEFIGTDRTLTGTADAQEMEYTITAWQGVDVAAGGCTASTGG